MEMAMRAVAAGGNRVDKCFLFFFGLVPRVGRREGSSPGARCLREQIDVLDEVAAHVVCHGTLDERQNPGRSCFVNRLSRVTGCEVRIHHERQRQVPHFWRGVSNGVSTLSFNFLSFQFILVMFILCALEDHIFSI